MRKWRPHHADRPVQAGMVVVTLATFGVVAWYLWLIHDQLDGPGDRVRVLCFALFLITVATIQALAAGALEILAVALAIKLGSAATSGLLAAGVLAILSIGWVLVVLGFCSLGLVVASGVITRDHPDHEVRLVGLIVPVVVPAVMMLVGMPVLRVVLP